MDLKGLRIKDMQSGLAEGKFTSVELLEAVYKRIESADGEVGAFLSLAKESALESAKESDARRAKGESAGSLDGIPVAIKDNICMKGVTATCASKMLEDFYPPYDATVVKKLKKAGAVIVGKTNMDEFAMGSSTENSYYKKTKNPWDLSKVPGGSSGGAAASVAAGMVPISFGSDTGGSIRQPAAFCGAVGLKPTYGRVSRYGLIAFGSSLDQIGPIAPTVEEVALAFEVVTGMDRYDATSVHSSLQDDFMDFVKSGASGLRVAIPEEYLGAGLDEEIKESVLSTAETLKKLGATVEYVSLPLEDAALSAYYVVASAEASSNLARFDGVRYGYRTEEFDTTDELMIKSRSEGFGEEVKRRIMIGTYALSSGYYDAYYKKAMQYRKSMEAAFDKIFESYDLVLSPASPVLPFGIGEKTDDPLAMYLADVYTVNINMAGLPALAMPCGISKAGLPIGLQFIGRKLEEATILKAAYGLEQALELPKTALEKEGA